MRSKTAWIPSNLLHLTQIALMNYDIPSDVVEAITKDRDDAGGLYTTSILDRAAARGYGAEAEAALLGDE